MSSTYKISEGFFKTFDGLNLFYRFYQHPQSIQTLVFLHGHGEHSGRYLKFADYLYPERLSLAFFDIRGYGRSEGEACYVRNYQDYLSDFSSFTAHLENAYELKPPFYIFAHSNGGLQAIHWALQYPAKTKALFLSSPFLGLKLPAPLMLLGKFISFVMPHFVFQNPVYPPYLTHNLQELENYKKDPLIRRKITARLLTQMIKYQHLLESLSNVSVPFPVCVLMSGLDRVVDAAKTRLFYDRVDTPLKDMEVFSGLYHEIFNELGQEKVFAAFLRQIEKVRLAGF